MLFRRTRKETGEETELERLRKFRSMHAAQYGKQAHLPSSTPPIRGLEEVHLCIICSEPMQGPVSAPTCPAAEASPELHARLQGLLAIWRGGQVTGRTIPHFSKTVALMRQALKQAVHGPAQGSTAEPEAEASGPDEPAHELAPGATTAHDTPPP
jgi:hypothetical protein